MNDSYRLVSRLLGATWCDHLVATATSLWIGEQWRISCPHRASIDFLRVMSASIVLDLVRPVIGDCDGMGSDYFFHAPGQPGMPPHTDNFYVQAPPGTMLSVWIALCDVTRENGCLHANGTDIIVPKGGAVLIGQECPHGSHENRSRAPRHALLLTYIAKGASFNPGALQRRERVPLDLQLERME